MTKKGYNRLMQVAILAKYCAYRYDRVISKFHYNL